MMKIRFIKVVALLLGFMVSGLWSCSDKDDDSINKESEILHYTINEDWTEETHSNDVSPNYEEVFPEDELLRIDIKISSADWSEMQSDLSANMSTGGPGMGGPVETNFDPIWVPATLTYNGKNWHQVGIRYKGNSTLRNAYSSGTDKYPFKLDFDEFEDDYPEINNQRFYGFKQLNLSSNDSDDSFMREKVASDLFREFGVPSARTSFCEVYLDRGNGTTFLGIYTMVEEVDDSLVESQFDDDSGNLYKPDGDAATFASGTFDESELDLKRNEEAGDYSDVKALYDVLHASNRIDNPILWQDDLESIFDVDQFLKYLAVNNIIQNWDTYGVMTHNYFLYNDEGRLVWIPWDNNESMQDGKMGGALSLSMDQVTNDWPLIRYIMDIDEYESVYKDYVKEFSEGLFSQSQMELRIEGCKDILSAKAKEESNLFDLSVDDLKQHVIDRQQAVNLYLK